jgi:hypothetical protein
MKIKTKLPIRDAPINEKATIVALSLSEELPMSIPRPTLNNMVKNGWNFANMSNAFS